MLSLNFSTPFFTRKIDFPERYRSKNLAKVVSIQFLLVFTALYLFKPFVVNESELRCNYFIICCLHAFLPAFITGIYITALGYARKRLHMDDWTLKRELINVAVLFFIIGLSGFLLRGFIYNNSDNLSWRYLWIEVRNVYLAGMVFSLFLISARYYFLSTSDKPADQYSPERVPPSPSECSTASPVFIKAYVRIDDFYFNPDDLLFAKAEGNYITLITLENDILKTELRRISLKQFEAQLAGYAHLLRCHRAYLLNVKRIARLTGNSQGYWISFDETEQKVPVSRAYLDVFKQVYQS